MSKSELLVAEQVERADFSSADICSAKPPAVPEAVKRHRKPPEGRVLQGFHEPPPKSVTVSKVQLDLTEAANTRKRLRETRGDALPRSGPCVARNVTVHESMVTSVQKRMGPRRSLLGASVDPTEARWLKWTSGRGRSRRDSNRSGAASAFSRIRAWANFLAAALPEAISC